MDSAVTGPNGITLAYDEAGEGEPTLLLLHGMLCARAHMAPLARLLSARRRVVWPDLRGHGESSRPPGEYPIDAFGEDLVWFLERLSLRRPVLVGHSFGGTVALAFANRHPELVAGIVLLDSGVRDLAAKAADVGSNYQEIRELDGEAYRVRSRRWLEAHLFAPYDPPELVEQMVEFMLSMPRETRLALSRSTLAFDGRAAALACRLPALLVLSDRPFTDATTLAALPSNWFVGRTVGSGHNHHLVVPGQISQMIERFLQLL